MNKMEKRIYEIKENQSFSLKNTSKELKYIKKNFPKCFDFISGEQETIIRGRNIVGILDLGKSIYRIYPKVGDILNIFNMINKISKCKDKNIKSEGYFYIDPKVIVNIEESSNKLIEKFILIFLSEIERVSKIGYTKTYNKKSTNEEFVKGKLNISKQISKNFLGTKFWCKYNDLTYCTDENLILINTVNKLLKDKNLNREYRSKLLMHKNELEKLIDVNLVFKVNLRSLMYEKNRTNSHYDILIAMCRIILSDKFSSSIKDGDSKFSNFMIKTDLLFEQYIFVLLNELIEEKYKNYYIEYQHTINSVKKVKELFKLETCEKKFLKMDTDILIFDKETNKPVLVIDTKYIDIFGVNKLDNYAYYQMISYLVGLKASNNISAILLAHGDHGNIYRIPDEKYYMYILTKGINILDDELCIKEKLDEIISPFL
ncbi:5-methylcytosine restriction system specificity protein McrC [Clostridium sp.]|uniref:5-methylcytosine restriction system specificity protein McrC n=1 Tax=Clostridium sp. TaxID=1506 RepID=UPI0029162DFD|nr:hypothetical protein [Clostridium sp.]